MPKQSDSNSKPVKFLAGPNAPPNGFGFRLRGGPDGKVHATRSTPIVLTDPEEIEIARTYADSASGRLEEVTD